MAIELYGIDFSAGSPVIDNTANTVTTDDGSVGTGRNFTVTDSSGPTAYAGDTFSGSNITMSSGKLSVAPLAPYYGGPVGTWDITGFPTATSGQARVMVTQMISWPFDTGGGIVETEWRNTDIIVDFEVSAANQCNIAIASRCIGSLFDLTSGATQACNFAGVYLTGNGNCGVGRFFNNGGNVAFSGAFTAGFSTGKVYRLTLKTRQASAGNSTISLEANLYNVTDSVDKGTFTGSLTSGGGASNGYKDIGSSAGQSDRFAIGAGIATSSSATTGMLIRNITVNSIQDPVITADFLTVNIRRGCTTVVPITLNWGSETTPRAITLGSAPSGVTLSLDKATYDPATDTVAWLSVECDNTVATSGTSNLTAQVATYSASQITLTLTYKDRLPNSVMMFGSSSEAAIQSLQEAALESVFNGANSYAFIVTQKAAVGTSVGSWLGDSDATVTPDRRLYGAINDGIGASAMFAIGRVPWSNSVSTGETDIAGRTDRFLAALKNAGFDVLMHDFHYYYPTAQYSGNSAWGDVVAASSDTDTLTLTGGNFPANADYSAYRVAVDISSLWEIKDVLSGPASSVVQLESALSQTPADGANVWFLDKGYVDDFDTWNAYCADRCLGGANDLSAGGRWFSYRNVMAFLPWQQEADPHYSKDHGGNNDFRHLTSTGSTLDADRNAAHVAYVYLIGAGITVSGDSSMDPAGVQTLTASIAPVSDPSSPPAGVVGVTWSVVSGDSVTVNSSTGEVTAVGSGTSVVRATSVYNSNIYDDFTISVGGGASIISPGGGFSNINRGLVYSGNRIF